LGIGDWGLGPIPNPQSPIPNPQSPCKLYNLFILIKYLNLFIKILIYLLLKLKYIYRNNIINILK